MKTTDFMVGDWLRTSRGNAKVIAVDKIGLTFKIDGGDFDNPEVKAWLKRQRRKKV